MSVTAPSQTDEFSIPPYSKIFASLPVSVNNHEEQEQEFLKPPLYSTTPSLLLGKRCTKCH